MAHVMQAPIICAARRAQYANPKDLPVSTHLHDNAVVIKELQRIRICAGIFHTILVFLSMLNLHTAFN